MSQAVAYQIEHWLRINYDRLEAGGGGGEGVGGVGGGGGSGLPYWLSLIRVGPNQRQTH